MKIIYLSNSSIPSNSANSIQVIKMCNSFAKTNNLILFARPSKNIYKFNIVQEIYGIENNFKIIYLKNKSDLIFSLKAITIIIKNKPNLIYGRNIWGIILTSLLGYNSILEIHAPKFDEIKILKRIFLKIIFKRKNFKNLILTTNYLKKEFISSKIKIKKILVLPDASELQKNYYEKMKL